MAGGNIRIVNEIIADVVTVWQQIESVHVQHKFGHQNNAV